MVKKSLSYVFCFLIIISCQIKPTDRLREGFQDPPSYTRPWVYWYWIDENISREGITKDLEAMARVGIGKALLGHVSPGNQRGNVRILSEPWWEMIEHAVREGQRLGVDIGFFNGPGWSQSGGPWIRKDQAMRYVISKEIQVTGPTHFQGNFSSPDTLFDRIALQAFPARGAPTSPSLHEIKNVHSDPELDGIKNLFDRKESTHFLFPDTFFSDSSSLTIDLQSQDQVALQNITFDFLPISMLVDITLQVREKNSKYKTIRQFTLDRRNINFEIGPMRFDPSTFSLPVSRSNEYRIIFSNLTGTPGAGFKEVTLGTGARVDQSIEKQLGKMYSDPLPPWNAYLWGTQAEPAIEDLIDPDQIIDLTGKIDSADNLTWEVPEGNWILLQSGMIPTGATNVPVPPEATGYECDKFTEEAVETHFEAFIGKFLERVPAKERKSLKTVVIDSYEVGPQNWTDDFRNIFMAKYGYDPIPWLPVFSGRIVGSADLSNRFLWDVRRLTADLISNVYVRRLRELSNENGLDLWLENYGHWGFPGEFLQYGGQANQVSGEFWFENTLWDLGPLECRTASSAAHIYGKKQVFAEAFTAGFNFLQYPAIMKSRGDRMFCEGINHFVQHVSIHQPWDDRIPGVTAWFGMSYHRHNTWFEQSKAWNEYLQRCHYLLQLGLPVSDVCYFIGEDTPKMTGILEPVLPYGYDYDFINADVILNRLSVQDGTLVLPDGKHYQLLVLPPLETMRPEVLKKIHELLQNGASVYGPPPSHSPSLENYPDADAEVESEASKLWRNINGTTTTHRNIGEGQLFYGEALDCVFEKLRLEPDVICLDTAILWTHRRSEDMDIYFLTNQEAKDKTVEISFRIAGKIPELWFPDIGKIQNSAFFDQSEDRTFVPFRMEPFGSVFIIFRKPIKEKFIKTVYRDGTDVLSGTLKSNIPSFSYSTDGNLNFKTDESGNFSIFYNDGQQVSVSLTKIPPSMEIDDPWEVHFPDNWDAPQVITFEHPMSWTGHPNAGIKYFSGTARYLKKIFIPKNLIQPDLHLILDLGEVLIMAEVIVNGQNLGIIWKKPYQIDITSVIQSGENHIEIRVTNTWWNRLVGDEKYPHGFPGNKIDHPRTFTTIKAWNAESELMPSGLIGPVRIEVEKIVTIGKRK